MEPVSSQDPRVVPHPPDREALGGPLCGRGSEARRRGCTAANTLGAPTPSVTRAHRSLDHGAQGTLNSRLADVWLCVPRAVGAANPDSLAAETLLWTRDRPQAGVQRAPQNTDAHRRGLGPHASSTLRLGDKLVHVSTVSVARAPRRGFHLPGHLRCTVHQQVAEGNGGPTQEPLTTVREPRDPRHRRVFRSTRARHWQQTKRFPARVRPARPPRVLLAHPSGPLEGVRHTDVCHLLGNPRPQARPGPGCTLRLGQLCWPKAALGPPGSSL